MANIPSGWPCAILSVPPPSIKDRETAPSADDLLPQILALGPRGPAWGTDETGDGRGASPVQRRFWRGLATWVADHLTRDAEAASQTFPSAITYSLPDWEQELGLPDPCGSDQGGTFARIAAVRARFATQGGASPEYFVCLAAAAGYSVTIEEPTQALCDVTECVDPATSPGTIGDEVAGGLLESFAQCDDAVCDDTPIEGYAPDPTGTIWKFWIVHVSSLGETWFEVDTGECDFDPIEGFVPAVDLECLLRRVCPPHTQLVFNYSGLA